MCSQEEGHYWKTQAMSALERPYCMVSSQETEDTNRPSGFSFRELLLALSLDELLFST